MVIRVNSNEIILRFTEEKRIDVGFFWSGCENVKEKVQESWRALDTKFVFHSFSQIFWEKSGKITCNFQFIVIIITDYDL